MRGEATPAYAILDAADVARIATLLPGLRVVFVLRNPVERAWSHLRYRHGDAIRTGRMSPAAMREFVDSPEQRLRGDYLRTLEIWSRHVPETRLHVTFYDHLVADPGRFFERICGFLGVEVGLPAPPDRSRVINAASRSPMPPDLRHHLASRYREPIARLADAYGDPPARLASNACKPSGGQAARATPLGSCCDPFAIAGRS